MNSSINKKVNIIRLGNIDYQEAWDYQESLFKKTVDVKIDNRKKADLNLDSSTENFLILCEHPHVYTLGKSGSLDNLLLDSKGLKDHDATFYKINRGGDITYHGPGQIVCYPIIDLENFFTDIHKYLRLLEEAVILTLKEYDVDAGRIEGLTGVWVDYRPGDANPRKICAMGVKSSRWVTMHGLAFNINTDLSYFKHIIPCGIDDKAVTSLNKELGHDVLMEEVEGRLINNISRAFEMQLLNR
jgi:lipoyl(octanoyl) transferase